MEKRVAVYNNNTGVIEIMSSLLAGEGLKMVEVTGRAQLQELLRAQEIQLLLLDVELDGRGWGEGIEMIHDIRNMTTIPVIIISAQDAETAKIMALNAGADDYVTVGYNPLELLARVKSQLRRYTQLVNLCESIDSIYRVDGLEINDRNRTVTVDGREVKMTPIEYKILRLLVHHAKRAGCHGDSDAAGRKYIREGTPYHSKRSGGNHKVLHKSFPAEGFVFRDHRNTGLQFYGERTILSVPQS